MGSKLTTIRIPDRLFTAMDKTLVDRTLGKSLTGFINQALYQHLYTLGKLKLTDREKELLDIKEYEVVEEESH